MLRIKLLVMAVCLVTLCYSQSINKKFEIRGELTGFPDHTYMKLYDFATGSNVFMDSAQIINGKFLFRGSIKSEYQKLGFIYTTKTADGYTPDISVFWVEGGLIHFKGKKGDFEHAEITGSPMQTEAAALYKLSDEAGDASKDTLISYIKQHPNSLIGGEVLEIYCKSWGKDTTQWLYKNFSDRVKQSQFGKNIYSYLSLYKDIKIGDTFVDFTLPNTRGENISLSNYKGKYVLLDFWGSWCGPCRKENPELVKTYSSYRSKGFEVLGVSVETNKEWWERAIKEDNIAWESVSDLKGDKGMAVMMYGVDHFPANFLIDPNGVIIAKDLHGDELKSKLAELLP
ncbi:MAG: TlpA disulfide reductase family protein [Agriterribacter sp.]